MASKYRITLVLRIILLSLISFSLNAVLGLNTCSALYAQSLSLELPAPNKLLKSSGLKSYPILKGLKIDPENPLDIDFLLDSQDQAKIEKSEAQTLVNYFLAALAADESDLWVNLSPYEEDRILSETIARTELGQELMAQDYILKQFSSSLSNPETSLGKRYWKSLLGTSPALSSNNLNKIWIVPAVARVIEQSNAVYVEQAELDVMLESDFLASKKEGIILNDSEQLNSLNELVLPLVRDEVNEGESFARLRQVYNSVILAKWFKLKFFNSFYKHYIGQKKMAGIDANSPGFKEELFKKYLSSFNNGVYNSIKKELYEGRKVKRRYFSGGLDLELEETLEIDGRQIIPKMRGQAFYIDGKVDVVLGKKSASSSALVQILAGNLNRGMVDLRDSKYAKSNYFMIKEFEEKHEREGIILQEPIMAAVGSTDMPEMFIYGRRDEEGKLVLHGNFIANQLRGLGYMNSLLTLFFTKYPEVEKTHINVRNLVLLNALAKRGFEARDKSNVAYIAFGVNDRIDLYMDKKTSDVFIDNLGGDAANYNFVQNKSDDMLAVYFATEYVLTDREKLEASFDELILGATSSSIFQEELGGIDLGTIELEIESSEESKIFYQVLPDEFSGFTYNINAIIMQPLAKDFYSLN